eukprot:211381_1
MSVKSIAMVITILFIWWKCVPDPCCNIYWACIGEHGRVVDMNNNVKKLKDVKIGDYIFDGDKYTKVIAVELNDNTPLEMITLYMNKIDKMNTNVFTNITLTGDHLLYDNNNKLVASQDIEIGDVLYNGYTVYDVKTMHELSSTPITMSGYIQVNDVKTSCYILDELFAKRVHKVLSLFRWTSNNVNEYYTGKLIETGITDAVEFRNKVFQSSVHLDSLFSNDISAAIVGVFSFIFIVAKDILFSFF